MNLLESLGQGLRGVGGILDEGVYKGQRQEDQLMQMLQEKRKDTMLAQLIKGRESGAIDESTFNEQIKKFGPGYEGLKVSITPEVQQKQEEIKRRDAISKGFAGLNPEDRTNPLKVAEIFLNNGDHTNGINFINKAEERQERKHQVLLTLEQRQREAELRSEDRLATREAQEAARREANELKKLHMEGTKAYQEEMVDLRRVSQAQNAENQRENRALRREGQQTNADIRQQREEDRREDRANKPLNEGQGRAVNFGTRAAKAHDVLNSLEDNISTTGLAAKQAAQRIPGIGGALGVVGNVALSADQQRVEQAQRDFVNANLRQESGAVISESEFENARKQYFPQPGDSKDVIAQKKRNRETAISGFKRQAGKGSTFIDEDRESAGALLPKPKGSIRDQADAILGR